MATLRAMIALPFLLGALLIALLLLLIGLNQLSWTLIFIALGIAILYLATAERLHFILALVPPAFLLGEVFTWRVLERYQYEMTGSELLLIFLAFSFLITTTLKDSWKTIRIPRLGMFLLALLGFEILSYFWVADTDKYLIAVRVLVYHLAGFFLLVNLVRTKGQFRLLLGSFLVTVILASIQLLVKLQEFGGFQLIFERQFIRTNIGPLATVVSIIVLFLPIALTQVLERRSLPERVLAGVAAGIGIVTSLLTLGRAALISFFAGIAYLTWRFKWRRTIVIVMLVVLLVTSTILFQTLFENVFLRWKTLFTDASNTFRVLEMKTGLSVFASHPILGAGAGNLKYWYRSYLRDYEGESNNIIVQMLAEFGIVGAILVGFILWELWKLLRPPLPASSPLSSQERGRRRAELAQAPGGVRSGGEVKSHSLTRIGFEASIVVAALHSMVEVTVINLPYGLLFWMLIGLFLVRGEVEDAAE